jgi:hypothetical protein
MTPEQPAGALGQALIIQLYFLALFLMPVIVRQFWGLATAKRWIIRSYLAVPVLLVLACLLWGLPFPAPGAANIPTGTGIVYGPIFLAQFFILAWFGLVWPWGILTVGVGLMMLLPHFEAAWQAMSGRARR